MKFCMNNKTFFWSVNVKKVLLSVPVLASLIPSSHVKGSWELWWGSEVPYLYFTGQWRSDNDCRWTGRWLKQVLKMSGIGIHTDRVKNKHIVIVHRKGDSRPVTQGQSGDRLISVSPHLLTWCLPVELTLSTFQWRWALRSYFSQNLSVKGMQVSNSHQSHLIG